MANNIEKAKLIIDKRREQAESEAEARRRELESVSPELRAVNARIASAGLRAVRAIGMGKDAKLFMEELAKENLAAQAERREILGRLGVPEDSLEVHYTCPVCEDTGSKDGRYCQCLKSLVKELQHKGLCDVAPAGACTFGSFDLNYYKGVADRETGDSAYERMEAIYNYCKAYAEDFDMSSPSIIMYGNTGLGKTHLSLAIANVVNEKGYNVIYTTAHSLLGKIEKEHFGRLKTDEEPEEEALGCDLLIIDDLGAEFSTQFTISAVYNIINERILTGRPTIISTNLMYEAISDRYTSRVYSRIIGGYTPLEFIGNDVRQLKDY